MITGQSIDNLKLETSTFLRRRILISTALFVLGFTIVFTLAGAVAGTVGKWLGESVFYLNIIGGLFVILIGLQMTEVFKLKGLEKVLSLQKHIDFNLSVKSQYITAFLVGLVFAIACSYCIAPTLYSVLIYAGTTGSVSQGMLLMFLFSIGLAIPYLLVGYSYSHTIDKNQEN